MSPTYILLLFMAFAWGVYVGIELERWLVRRHERAVEACRLRWRCALCGKNHRIGICPTSP
jgi:hypothetical protein